MGLSCDDPIKRRRLGKRRRDRYRLQQDLLALERMQPEALRGVSDRWPRSVATPPSLPDGPRLVHELLALYPGAVPSVVDAVECLMTRYGQRNLGKTCHIIAVHIQVAMEAYGGGAMDPSAWADWFGSPIKAESKNKDLSPNK